MTSQLAPGRYRYDALSIGDRIESASVEITADLIDTFADMTGDHFEIHMDDAAARPFLHGGEQLAVPAYAGEIEDVGR